MRVEVSTLEQMRGVAVALAGRLCAGDLIILTGNLGAGKTTFTQALGKALDVAGRITSPTFVIAREHLSRSGGPTLVHVDAYRLADGEELEDLDLDSELDESITVVEWGAGMAEQLSSDFLEITITPVWDGEAGDVVDDAENVESVSDEDDADDDVEDERRSLELTGHGPVWAERLPQILTAFAALEGITTEEDAS